MLRVVGLVMLLVVGIAGPVEAADGDAGEAAASAARPGTATRGARPPVQQSAPSLRLTRASTEAQWSPWGAWSTGFRRDVVTRTAGLAALPPGRREPGGLLAPWLGQGKSSLRLAVTERLSFGVAYRRLQGEDLWRRYAEAGSVDYDSHDFLLRANWRF